MRSLKFLVVAVLAVALALSGCAGGGGGGGGGEEVASATIGFRLDALAVAQNLSAAFFDRVNNSTLAVEVIGAPLLVVGNLVTSPFNTLTTGNYIIGFNAIDTAGLPVYADEISTFAAVDQTVITVLNINFVPLLVVPTSQIGYMRIPRLGIFNAAFIIRVDENGNVILLPFPGGAGGTITVP